MTTLLEVRDLHVQFRTQRGVTHAVNGIDLTLRRGETVGLVGESGCGKSVTALAILGLLPAPAGRVTGGYVLLEGRDLLPLDETDLRQVRGSEVAMVFQDPMTSLNPVMTIGQQLTEVLRAHVLPNRRQARRRAMELLTMVGIPSAASRLDDYPHQFSGGMRQRVMVAMAVACEPKLLIADEPTTALDVTIQAQILALLRRLVADSDMALLLITHDLGVVAGICKQTNVMYAGRIAETGATGDLFAKPRHPYTVGLLRSIPRLGGARKTALVPIPGAPPSLTARPVGCPFAPRCPRRVDELCWRLPEPEPVPGAALGQLAACFNPVPQPEPTASRP